MSKAKKGKVNPQKQPRSQADVNRAYGKGLQLGLKCADLVWFNVLLDKHSDAVDMDILWKEVIKLQHEIAKGRVTWPDLAKTLKEEYLMMLDYK